MKPLVVAEHVVSSVEAIYARAEENQRKSGQYSRAVAEDYAALKVEGESLRDIGKRLSVSHTHVRYSIAALESTLSNWHDAYLWAMGRDPMMTSNTPEWSTPQDLFDALDAEFHFTLDVCATDQNAKCEVYFTRESDGLSQDWSGVCWMNPPYGDEIADWVAKARNSVNRATVVCLVPARVDTEWWWNHCRYGEIRFLRGRLKFGGAKSGAPFPSAVVVFRLGKNGLIHQEVRWWEWQKD